MKPILFEPEAISFDNNGIGFLSDAVSCFVTEELNGQFSLEMTYPMDGDFFGEIRSRSIILAKTNPVSELQPFRVYRISKPMNKLVKVCAYHISQDLTGVPVGMFAADSVAEAMNRLSLHAQIEHPFSFETDKSTKATMTVKVPSLIKSVLHGTAGGILDTYGGEYEFDRFKVKLWNQRGMDRGVVIRYGKNLTDLTQEENCSNVYTGVYPYWSDTDGNVLELPEKILNVEGDFSFRKIKMLDLSTEYQEQPTVAQLRTAATQYMDNNDIGVPKVSLDVSFVQLEQTEEYKGTAHLERVLLGDTVSVYFPALGVSAKAKVRTTVYNSILERYESVSIGDARPSIAQTIGQTQEQIKKLPTQTSLTQEIAQKLAAAMGVSGGCIRLLDTNGDGEPDELYIADDPDPAQALKVWRFNYLGWAVSKTGYNGPFIMGATIEDGLLADFVTAAHLVAGTIQSQDGSFFMDLDNGIIRMTIIDDAVSTMESTIQAETQRATSAESALTASISTVSNGLSLKVSKGDVSSQISLETGEVSLKGNRVTIESDNFNLSRTGEVAAVGEFKAIDGNYYSQLSAGVLQFRRKDTETGNIDSLDHYLFSSIDTYGADNKLALVVSSVQDGVIVKASDAEDVYSGIYLNGGMNSYGFTEKLLLYGSTRIVSGNVTLGWNLYWGTNGTYLGPSSVDNVAGTGINGALAVWGSIACTGTKYRVVETENYGKVGMNAIESANAVFSDMGSVLLDDNGSAEVFLDPVFAETVDLNHDYYVFTSSGEVSKIEKHDGYFSIHGVTGACVDWIVFYRQKTYTTDRLETVTLEKPEEEPANDMSVFYDDGKAVVQSEDLMKSYEVNYEAQAEAYLNNYEQEIYGYDY